MLLYKTHISIYAVKSMDLQKVWENSGDFEAISVFIRKVYDEFIAPDFPEEGNRRFYQFIDPEALKKRFEEPDSLLTARMQSRIVGVIGTREMNHICLFFVSPEEQGRGIGRLLFHAMAKKCRENYPEISDLTVNSSPYSVPVYENLGFKASDSMQERDGITYLPMKFQFSAKAL